MYLMSMNSSAVVNIDHMGAFQLESSFPLSSAPGLFWARSARTHAYSDDDG